MRENSKDSVIVNYQ